MRHLRIALLLIAAACGGNETPSRSEPSSADPLKVGLLTPGSVNDGGWNAVAWEGLQRIENELGATIGHQETKTPAEFEEGFRSFGARGFDLAFGHGFEFQDAAMKAGREYPQTVFITTSGSSVAANVAPMVFELEEATYLLGIIAARESRTGKAGVVGGIELPSIQSTFIAFEAGAKSVRPDFEVRRIYTGNFDDVAAARLAALTLANAGADFLFHQANEAGRGVFQACRERAIRCFGSNRNQNALAPDVIVASAVMDAPAAFVRTARMVAAGQFRPEVQWLGMREGIVSLVWNDALKSAISPATVAEVERVEGEIRSGAFEVPRGRF